MSLPLVNTQWLIELLQEKELRLQDISQAISLPLKTRESALFVLSLSDYLSLLNWAASELHDPHFGLTTARHIRPDDFGPALYLSYNTANLREFFQSLHQMDTQISAGLNITFREGPVISQLVYHVILPTEADPHHDIEQSLSLLSQLFQKYVSATWRPLRVNFSHSKPHNCQRLIEEFGEEIHFEQANNSLSFDSSLLDTRITDANPLLLKVLQQQIEKSLKVLKRHDNLISKVHYLLSLSLSSGQSDSEHIAKQLYMSRRTLVRHLSEQGASFRLIKEDVIETMAKEALTETNTSISQIALQLGYSETSAFDRTFKKLTGYTPRAYRQRALSL